MKLKKVVAQLSYVAITLSACNAITVQASEYIVPAMVNIPAGNFTMGTNVGDNAAKPAHQVKVDAFQMAKYPVTVAEFRKFVADTNFVADQTCKDKLDKNWLSSPRAVGSASWDNNRYLKSEYQPVNCVNFKEAQAYVNWLNDKTGQQYRLPTEAEFEYAAKANTNSRYFWGDDPARTQACLYGNFADQAGEYYASTQHGASYVGFLEYANCDDGEPYIAIVGLYRPNPFGLFDMAGNISEILNDCYYEGYPIREGEDMNTQTCQTISHRGENWHYPPQPHYARSSYARAEWSATATLGFRLAKDGVSDSVHPSTKQFESKLKQAQIARLKTRKVIPEAPNQVHLKRQDNGRVTLSWQVSENSKVQGYEIYGSKNPYAHLLGGYFKNHYELLTEVDSTTTSLVVKPKAQGQSYRILAKTGDMTSLPSRAVSTTVPKRIDLPGRLDMQEAIALDGVRLKHRPKSEEKSELFYISAFSHRHEQHKMAAHFNVNVATSGWYTVKYNGFAIIQQGEFFNIWQNNNLVGQIDFNEDVDDSKSNRHKVYLEAGEHTLEISNKKEGLEIWSLGWVEFNKL